MKFGRRVALGVLAVLHLSLWAENPAQTGGHVPFELVNLATGGIDLSIDHIRFTRSPLISIEKAGPQASLNDGQAKSVHAFNGEYYLTDGPRYCSFNDGYQSAICDDAKVRRVVREGDTIKAYFTGEGHEYFWEFKLDSKGSTYRLSREEGPGGGTTFVRDAWDNLVTKRDRYGNTTSYFYQLVTEGQYTGRRFLYKVVQGSQTTTYGYNSSWDLETIYINGIEKYKIRYSQGKPTEFYELPSGNGLGVTYDTQGRVVSWRGILMTSGGVINTSSPTNISYPAPGTAVVSTASYEIAYKFEVNSKGMAFVRKVSSTSGDSVEYTYDAVGQLTGIDSTLPGGVKVSQRFGYNPNAQILGLVTTETSDGTLSTETTYNPIGQPLSLKNSATGQYIVEATYDSSGRLSKVVEGSSSVTNFGYDSLGCLVSVSENGIENTRTANQYCDTVSSVDPNGLRTSLNWGANGCGRKGVLNSIMGPFGDATVTSNCSSEEGQTLKAVTRIGNKTYTSVAVFDPLGNVLKTTDIAPTGRSKVKNVQQGIGQLVVTVQNPDGTSKRISSTTTEEGTITEVYKGGRLRLREHRKHN